MTGSKIGTHSIVSEKAKIGKNVTIGRFCIVEDKVKIDDDAVIGDYSLIQADSIIGAGTKFGTYTKIGNNVEIGANCSFTSYCEIRDRCKIGNNVRMGSRCTLSAGTVIEDFVNIKYSTVIADTPDLLKDNQKSVGCIKEGARIGANVTIMPGVVIGRNSEIGACSQVRHNVPDNEIWYGNPSKFFKKTT